MDRGQRSDSAGRCFVRARARTRRTCDPGVAYVCRCGCHEPIPAATSRACPSSATSIQVSPSTASAQVLRKCSPTRHGGHGDHSSPALLHLDFCTAYPSYARLQVLRGSGCAQARPRLPVRADSAVRLRLEFCVLRECSFSSSPARQLQLQLALRKFGHYPDAVQGTVVANAVGASARTVRSTTSAAQLQCKCSACATQVQGRCSATHVPWSFGGRRNRRKVGVEAVLDGLSSHLAPQPYKVRTSSTIAPVDTWTDLRSRFILVKARVRLQFAGPRITRGLSRVRRIPEPQCVPPAFPGARGLNSSRMC